MEHPCSLQASAAAAVLRMSLQLVSLIALDLRGDTSDSFRRQQSLRLDMLHLGVNRIRTSHRLSFLPPDPPAHDQHQLLIGQLHPAQNALEMFR